MWTRRAVRAAVFGLLVLLFAADLVLKPGGAAVTRAVDDLGTTVAALIATAAAVRRARSLRGRARTSWVLLAASFGAAALGECIWTWYELVLGQDTPFPSVADVAYLSFPALALVGLLLRPSSALLGQGRIRTVLDALLVAGSLFNISWVTALGATWAAGGDSRLAFGVGLAYPVSDVILMTVALVVLAQARARHGLALLTMSLFVQALTDSAYAWASAQGSYSSGALLDIGYVVGYLLLAEAAIRDSEPDAHAARKQATVLSMLLPYLPAAAGIAIAVWQLQPGLTNPAVMVGSGLVVILFVRQLLTLIDNRKLVDQVLAQREELRYLAFHDPLTSLANRALFNDRLEHAVALAERDLRPVAVLLADLDDFKNVNDSLGHPAGDELLLRVAERLQAATRSGDTVARLGGDEFAVLLENADDAWEVAERILGALDQPVVLNGRQVPTSASIGVAVSNADLAPVMAEELLKQADVAMYVAKQRGKGGAALYEASSADAVASELELRSDLIAAVGAGGLDVHYQPILGFDGELLGFESLSRWTRDGHPVSPAVFLPVAERAGLLGRLDAQVLMTTLTFADQIDVGRRLLFTVNVGEEQLLDPDLARQVSVALQEHRLDPAQLVIEIPENRFLPDRPAIKATLQALRELGVRLALDDFGVGWSSIERLQESSPDIVKLDRCFIEPLASMDASTAIVASMIDLAHSLGATVIAEGIEHPQQLATLRRLGCDAVQGYLMGRPMPATEAALLSSIPRARSGGAPGPSSAAPVR